MSIDLPPLEDRDILPNRATKRPARSFPRQHDGALPPPPPSRGKRTLRLVHAAAILLAGPAAAAPADPAGIYVIGDTRNVPGEIAKFDLDHVSGYTLRIPWSDIET